MIHRALIVDDDTEALDSLVDRFQSGPTICDEAVDPEKGLANIKKASRYGYPYDVAILDFVYSSEDRKGAIDVAMCHEIRSLMPRCLIIHVTSEVKNEEVQNHIKLAQINSATRCLTIEKKGQMREWTAHVLSEARKRVYSQRINGFLDSLGITGPRDGYPYSSSYLLVDLQRALDRGFAFLDEATLERLKHSLAWPNARGQAGISFREFCKKEQTA